MGPLVLIAHASESVRQLIKLHLACAGYEVTLAEDAVQAGRQVVRQPPDLILLDMEMPSLDGLEFMCSSAGVPLTPVIFLTARQAALERVERLGATACLVAPFSAELLFHAVARCQAPQTVAQVGPCAGGRRASISRTRSISTGLTR